MANFDANLIFWGTSPWQSASNYQSLAGLIGTASSASAVINLGVAEDLGVGNGEAQPKVFLNIATGITAAAAINLNFQFQGSTDSSNWTTYVETGALSTASFVAGNMVLPIDVPRRPEGIALPQYYRINVTASGGGTATISTGTIFGGIVLARPDSDDTLGKYPANFTVAA